jgi:hypothetical protein
MANESVQETTRYLDDLLSRRYSAVCLNADRQIAAACALQTVLKYWNERHANWNWYATAKMRCCAVSCGGHGHELDHG